MSFTPGKKHKSCRTILSLQEKVCVGGEWGILALSPGLVMVVEMGTERRAAGWQQDSGRGAQGWGNVQPRGAQPRISVPLGPTTTCPLPIALRQGQKGYD